MQFQDFRSIERRQTILSLSLTAVLLLLAAPPLRANMQQPWIDGSSYSGMFIAEHADILHEDLFIDIEPGFEHAVFRIRYEIECSEDGHAIPFAFLALTGNNHWDEEFDDGFTVELNGKLLSTNVPPDSTEITLRDAFDKQIDSIFSEGATSLEIWQLLRPEDRELKFFSANLNRGKHVIEARYRAAAHIDLSEYVREYRFHYALGPARHWKSFGSLNLVVNAGPDAATLTSNLPDSLFKREGQVLSAQFDGIPLDVIELRFTPEVAGFTSFVLWLSPFGTALIFIAPFFWLHIHMMHRWFGLKTGRWKYYVAFILGGLVVPFLFLAFLLLSDELTDYLIGAHAGGLHGTIYPIMFLWPFVFLIYLGGIAAEQKVLRNVAKKNSHSELDSEQPTD